MSLFLSTKECGPKKKMNSRWYRHCVGLPGKVYEVMVDVFTTGNE